MEKSKNKIIILTLILFLLIPKPIVICSDGCAFLISTNIMHTLMGIITLLSGFLGLLTGPNEFSILSLALIVLINIPIIYFCYKFSKFVVLFKKNKNNYSKKNYVIPIIGLLIIGFYFSSIVFRFIMSKNDSRIFTEIALQKLDTAENVESTAEKCKSVSNAKNHQCLISIIDRVNNIDFCDKKLYENYYFYYDIARSHYGLNSFQYNCRMRFIEKEKDLTLCERYMDSASDKDKCINTIKNLSSVRK